VTLDHLLPAPACLPRPSDGYWIVMIKSLMFLGGAAAGFAIASSMTDEQRRTVRQKATRVTKGEHSQRLADAIVTTKDSVADAAVTAVETAADKVADVAAKVESKVESKSEPVADHVADHVAASRN
jgi:gas vesicle protein